MAIRIESSTDTAEQMQQAISSYEQEGEPEASVTTSEEPAETQTAPAETQPAKKEESPAEAGASEQQAAPGAASETTKEVKEEDLEDESKLPKGVIKKLQEARRIKRELRETRERLEELERKPAAVKTESAPAPKPAETYSGKPKPKLGDFEETEDPYAAFAEAIGEWHAEEKFQKARAEAAQAEAESRRNAAIEAYAKRIPDARERYPDFDQVIDDADDTILLPPDVQEVIFKSDIGPYILYYLAKDPNRVRDIASLPEVDRLVAMGEVRAEVKASLKAQTQSASTAKKPPEESGAARKTKTVSSAPKPPEPVQPAGPAPRTLRELAGPEDREVDIRLNPEYERLRSEQRRGRW